MIDDFLILILRVFALVSFGLLLSKILRAFAEPADTEVWRSRVAVALLALSLTYTSVFATLIWMGVPVNREVGNLAIGSLSIAILNAAAAVACLWAFVPWRK